MPDAILMIINKYNLRSPKEGLLAEDKGNIRVAMWGFLLLLGDFGHLGARERKGISRPAWFSIVT